MMDRPLGIVSIVAILTVFGRFAWHRPATLRHDRLGTGDMDMVQGVKDKIPKSTRYIAQGIKYKG